MLEVRGSTYPARPGRVGTQRPSGFMFTAGIGGLIDLPHMTVIVDGLDRWDIQHSRVVEEARLLAAVRHRLGDQVAEMRTPPHLPETDDLFGDWSRVGVPVSPFPRWLRCTNRTCQRLGTMDSGLFELDFKTVNMEGSQFRHKHCRTPGGRLDSRAIAVRFVFACENGHLDDFPFDYFVHGPAGTCAIPSYQIEDFGQGLSPTVRVTCNGCQKSRLMVAAFARDAAAHLPACRGRNPHLGTFDSTPCRARPRAMILGASNLWFPQILTSLYLPEQGGDLPTLVRDNWHYLDKVKDVEQVALVVQFPDLQGLVGFPPEQILAAINARREPGPTTDAEPDLKKPEWDAFTAPIHGLAPGDSDFRLRPVDPPDGYPQITRVVQVERLREAKAFVGFTRIGPFDPETPGGPKSPKLTRGNLTWIPAVEGRGEGIFIQLDEPHVADWETRTRDSGCLDLLIDANRNRNRALGRPDMHGWPGERGVLLHTLAHALIRQVALDCGYAAASLTERIYAGSSGDPHAGILIYTTAADTEGTLGGLVALAEPSNLKRLLDAALRHANHCSADPLCAEHQPNGDTGVINGAACHLCTYTAETSCESNNRYLDRRTLADIGDNPSPFFAP